MRNVFERTTRLSVLVLTFAAVPAICLAQAPKECVIVSAEDIQAVLKHAADIKRTIPDNTIRVVDMGKYQLGVAVITRGALRVGGGGPNAVGSATPSNPGAMPCGEKRPGATGPGGIIHDDTAESYVILSGAGTLITGGTIVNGRRSAPDDEVTKILNGPSCSGAMIGFVSRDVKAGDVAIIPEGVPHGFSAIPDHITYLSIRPDLKKVLQHGYVNPAFDEVALLLRDTIFYARTNDRRTSTRVT